MRILFMFFILCMMTGCSTKKEAQSFQGETISAETESAKRDAEKGSGTSEHGILIDGDGDSLAEEQAEIIFTYMERYYTSLSSLEMQDLQDLFETAATENLELNRNAWEYLIGLRAMQKTDLTLDSYQYELTIETVEWGEKGELFIQLNENNIQRFAQHPDMDSEFYHIRHTFVLVEEEERWRLREHLQEDGIYQNIMGTYRSGESRLAQEDKNMFRSQKTALLKQAEELLQSRNKTGEKVDLPDTKHEYNRAAAAAYAENWTGRRNEIWDDFTGQGGNCQNFVSQCLYAGGIPRDITGEEAWSWKKADTDMREDRASTDSWINVGVFRRYAMDNRRYGLAAVPDAPYLEGDVGDVIQMGFPGSWSHTVLITRVITDEQGNTIDYLVDSNTADLKNFPVSAYSLPCQSLVKICGWNEY